MRMFVSNLQNFDIVHPVQCSGGSHDLMLNEVYPNFAGQLELWTNLAFDSDEPLAARHKNAAISIPEEKGEEGEETRTLVSDKVVHDGHMNIVIPANFVPETPKLNDSFAAHQPTSIPPSLPQLPVLFPSYIPSFDASLPGYIVDATASPSFTQPTSILLEEPNLTTAKRARTRRVSRSSTEFPSPHEESVPSAPYVSPAEDKRRRNTAASTRFRHKKKERELALEEKEKELKIKVDKLERECGDLRKENEWLKRLIIGITDEASLPASLTTTITGSNRRREESAT